MNSLMNFDLAAIPKAFEQPVGHLPIAGRECRMKPVGAERRSQQPALSRMIAAVKLHHGDAKHRLNLRRIASGRELRVGQRHMDIVIAAQNVGVRSRMKIQREFIAHDPVKTDRDPARTPVKRYLAASYAWFTSQRSPVRRAEDSFDQGRRSRGFRPWLPADA